MWPREARAVVYRDRLGTQSTLKGPLITKFSKLSENTEDINQSTHQKYAEP